MHHCQSKNCCIHRVTQTIMTALTRIEAWFSSNSDISTRIADDISQGFW